MMAHPHLDSSYIHLTRSGSPAPLRSAWSGPEKASRANTASAVAAKRPGELLFTANTAGAVAAKRPGEPLFTRLFIGVTGLTGWFAGWFAGFTWLFNRRAALNGKASLIIGFIGLATLIIERIETLA